MDKPTPQKFEHLTEPIKKILFKYFNPNDVKESYYSWNGDVPGSTSFRIKHKIFDFRIHIGFKSKNNSVCFDITIENRLEGCSTKSCCGWGLFNKRAGLVKMIPILEEKLAFMDSCVKL